MISSVRRVVRLVEVPCYDCGEEKHFHKSRADAYKCKRKRSGIRAQSGIRWDRELRAELLRQHESGLTIFQLAEALALGNERIRQQLKQAAMEVSHERLARAEMQQFKNEQGHWPLRLYRYSTNIWIEYLEDGKLVEIINSDLLVWASGDSRRLDMVNSIKGYY